MSEATKTDRRWKGVVLATAVASAAVAFLAMALLTNIFQRKQEAKNPYLRLVEVNEETTDSAPWGMNWARQYDGYRRTADVSRTQYGGSEALPDEKIDRDPWLKRLFAGYAFSIDYRDRRGHAYMLSDQEKTKRVTDRPQPGSCLHCHTAVIPTYPRHPMMLASQALTVQFARTHTLEGQYSDIRLQWSAAFF